MKKTVKCTIGILVLLVLIFIGGVIIHTLVQKSSPPMHPLVLIVEQKEGNPKQIMFGSMQITIPAGWKYETREEEGVVRLVLIDAHSECEDEGIRKHSDLYEHEITITPYQMPEDINGQIGLLADLLNNFQGERIENWMQPEELPEESLWIGKIYDRDSWINHYFFRSYNQQESREELFMVSEENFSGYGNDVEDFYYGYLQEGYIALHSGMVTITSPANRGDYLLLLKQKSSTPLLAMAEREDGITNVKVYLDNETQQPLTEFTYEKKYSDGPDLWDILDFNQDGCDDIGIRFLDEEWNSGYEGFLWNAEAQDFDFVNNSEFDKSYRKVIIEPELLITEQDRVPEGLIKEVSEALINGEQSIYDTMTAMADGKELTDEELLALSKKSPVINKYVHFMTSESSYAGIWLMQDVDNDGIDDILVEAYLGGTMGVVYYYLFKGEEDGSYTATELYEGIREEIAFIKWEGKNYLAQTTYDYDRKVYDGIRLTAFKDGQIAEVVAIQLIIADTGASHHVETKYIAEESYQDSLGSFIFDFTGGYDVSDIPQGTAEYLQGEYNYELEADIDNDGVLEQYKKTVWTPSNYYTSAGLNMMFNEPSEGIILEETIYKEAVPLFLWVDVTPLGNITYVLYEDNRYDFHICAYLLTEEKCELLMRVNHTFDLDVNVIRDVNLSSYVNA